MLLRISFLLLLLAVSARASAKKWYMPIEAIAAQAEYIVVGEIVAVQADTYQFRVAEYVKGSGGPSIQVQQFKEWTCDVRYAKPAKGQRLCLFLQQHAGALEIINGSSGELPILNDTVTLERETYAYRPGQPYMPYSIAVQEFTTGIKLFLRCFSIVSGPAASSTSAAVQLGSAEEMDAFRLESQFTGWLYERIKTRYALARK